MNIKIHNPNKLPTIDYREVEEFQGNLKDLTEDNYAKLKKSIEGNGFFIPMFLWKHKGKFKVLDAHQRLRVLKKEQVTPYEIPYIEIEAKDTNEAKKKLLLISSQYGTITQEGLDEFVFDLDLDTDWIADTINFDNITDFDKITDVEEDEYEVPDKIETDINLGDLFKLGDHRLLCGDATKKEDVEQLMDGHKADMVFTDPPYNYKTIKTAGIFKKQVLKVAEDIKNMIDFNPEQFFKTLPFYFNNNMSSFIFCNKDLVPKYLNLAIKSDYNFNILTWHKKTFIPLGGKHHYPDTEYCIFISKNPIFKVGLSSEHYYKYWIEAKDKIEERQHPTAKPINIIKLQIQLCSNKKGIVADPFSGSGSTLIACEQLNRKCFMMEISPGYCQVIIDRWEKYTAYKAEKIN